MMLRRSWKKFALGVVHNDIYCRSNRGDVIQLETKYGMNGDGGVRGFMILSYHDELRIVRQTRVGNQDLKAPTTCRSEILINENAAQHDHGAYHFQYLVNNQ